MSLQTKPAVEEKSRLIKLLGLIKEGEFTDAKEYADELLEQGISKTSINHSCYDYFKRLAFQDREKAEELAKTFGGYYWRAWLI